nr:DNA/RNA non-specific endonuclease [Alkalibacter mobilis]
MVGNDIKDDFINGRYLLSSNTNPVFEEIIHFDNKDLLFEGYTLLEVDGGDISGTRQPNVVVDIGFGEREYYGFTNEYGQLIKVVAKEIVLQDEKLEPVLANGRYYEDEAKVLGVESRDLDEGHVIGDALGGVANAYNITPQNSTLNRYGDQAYMEKVIIDAGGCMDFVGIISYPDPLTQIPDHYSFTYTIMGNVISEEFDNMDPGE